MTQQLDELIEMFRAEAHAKTPDPSRLIALLEGDLLHLERAEAASALLYLDRVFDLGRLEISRYDRYMQLLTHTKPATCANKLAFGFGLADEYKTLEATGFYSNSSPVRMSSWHFAPPGGCDSSDSARVAYFEDCDFSSAPFQHELRWMGGLTEATRVLIVVNSRGLEDLITLLDAPEHSCEPIELTFYQCEIDRGAVELLFCAGFATSCLSLRFQMCDFSRIDDWANCLRFDDGTFSLKYLQLEANQGMDMEAIGAHIASNIVNLPLLTRLGLQRSALSCPLTRGWDANLLSRFTILR